MKKKTFYLPTTSYHFTVRNDFSVELMEYFKDLLLIPKMAESIF
jgi:hypothetical protein